jgi:hypothetical protein
VATVAFLIDSDRATVDLGPAVTDTLTRLGVTSLAIYRDAATVCLVLDGWAFDASSSADAAHAIGFEPNTRVLRPVMQTALRADS